MKSGCKEFQNLLDLNVIRFGQEGYYLSTGNGGGVVLKYCFNCGMKLPIGEELHKNYRLPNPSS